VPLLARYDHYEATTGPPLPHLFQRRHGSRRDVMIPGAIRTMLNATSARTGLLDLTGPAQDSVRPWSRHVDAMMLLFASERTKSMTRPAIDARCRRGGEQLAALRARRFPFVVGGPMHALTAEISRQSRRHTLPAPAASPPI